MEDAALAEASDRAEGESCEKFFAKHAKSGFKKISKEMEAVSIVSNDHLNNCTATRVAYAERGDPRGLRVVYTCDKFYTVTDEYRAETVLHEVLHLAGKRHEDFGSPDPTDKGPFHVAVKNACPAIQED